MSNIIQQEMSNIIQQETSNIIQQEMSNIIQQEMSNIIHPCLTRCSTSGTHVRLNQSDHVAEWVKSLTCNQSVMSSNLVKDSLCFLEQETLHSLLSSSWFKEQVSSID